MAQVTEAFVRDMLAITHDDGGGSHAPLTIWEEAQLLRWWLESHKRLEQINLLACYASEENTGSQPQALLAIGRIARGESALSQSDGGSEHE